MVKHLPLPTLLPLAVSGLALLSLSGPRLEKVKYKILAHSVHLGALFYSVNLGYVCWRRKEFCLVYEQENDSLNRVNYGQITTSSSV